MPPARSGIADYSEALVEHMRPHAQVDVFHSATASFDAAAYDSIVYQIGNNGYHDFVYEAALRNSGIVALHESNLHHLVADLTIKRNDWNAYVEACEYDGGVEALAFAERVRRLEVGPDYENVRMLRRVLDASRGVIVHSRTVEADVRQAGFTGPLARIPHGAWLPEAGDRMGYRQRLGLEEQTPLIGIFGFLKPYKRIAESLRAFRRLLRVETAAKMILAGEPHPEFPLGALIRSLGLEASVRLLGFVPIEDFAGYMAACDIILNLRFPTVGESSGTLLRALGSAKAVIVSNVGSFAEFPDEVCLKVPVDASEEDALFEYLSLLVGRPEVARELGARARAWVAAECNWDLAARCYLEFAGAVTEGKPWEQPEIAAPVEMPEPSPPQQPPAPAVEEEYIFGWAKDEASREYIETHITRLEHTLSLVPPGRRILEMGAYLQITPALQFKLGYQEVRGCYYGPAGKKEHREITSEGGERFTCEVDLFDAEKDRFPYLDGYFDTVLCCELLEHLPTDPMFMMREINRITNTGGHLLLTTPNIASLRAIRAILGGWHPGFFPAYLIPNPDDARHAREYTPREIRSLFEDAGFEIVKIETGEFRDAPHPEDAWVNHLLTRYQLSTDLRGDGIFALGRKIAEPKKRYPAWLYERGE